MRFQLEIKLGNDAMQSAQDVATALQDVAARLESTYDDITDIAEWRRLSGGILDLNGNTVGRWEVIG